MTVSVVVMIIIGILFIIASFFVSENIFSKETNTKADLFTVDENYEFSDRELQIIKRKIEDVIAKHAKEIIYDTNESLSNMANEKTMALGDYAVAVCDEIEKNHKEVMFLYSMLDDKQKEIMNTVKTVDAEKKEIKDMYSFVKAEETRLEELTTKTRYSEDRRQQMQLEQLMNKEKEIDSAVNSLHARQVHNVDSDPVINNTAQNNSVDFDNASEPVSELNVADNTLADQDEVSNNIVSEESVPESSEEPGEISDPEEEIKDNFDEIFAEIDNTDIDFDDVLDNDFKEDSNANDIILEMYRGGNTIIQIAKELGLGVGEVKLVIDLYKGEV